MGRGDEPAGLSAPKDTVQSAKTDVSMNEASTADLVLDETSWEDPEKKNTNALLMLLIVMIFNTGAPITLPKTQRSHFVQCSNL